MDKAGLVGTMIFLANEKVTNLQNLQNAQENKSNFLFLLNPYRIFNYLHRVMWKQKSIRIIFCMYYLTQNIILIMGFEHHAIFSIKENAKLRGNRSSLFDKENFLKANSKIDRTKPIKREPYQPKEAGQTEYLLFAFVVGLVLILSYVFIFEVF